MIKKKFSKMLVAIMAVFAVAALTFSSGSSSVEAASAINVTVPVTIISARIYPSSLYGTTTLKIDNNGTATAKVKSITITPSFGWSIVDYSTGVTADDSKKFAMSIDGVNVATNGSVNVSSFGTVAAGASKTFNVELKFSSGQGGYDIMIGTILINMAKS